VPTSYSSTNTSPSSSQRQTYKTLIFYHGGGLTGGNRRRYISEVLIRLLVTGPHLDQHGEKEAKRENKRKSGEVEWLVICPDYHLFPESTVQDIRHDTVALEEWLCGGHAEEIGVDLRRVVVGGASAGMCQFLKFPLIPTRKNS
jgi:acetyl esterase/lipase